MRIYFITSKLNFQTAGGSIEEYDLMIRTWQKLGSQLTVITTFAGQNDILEPLPYPVIEEPIRNHGLIEMQWGIYQLLKKYEDRADIFHIDGHLYLYGAGLYRRLGGKTPIDAFFNRELMVWPEDCSTLFAVPVPRIGLLKQIKKLIRWTLEKYIGMYLANAIDVRSFISPHYKELYRSFGMNMDKPSLVIGDPIDLKKIMRENGIESDSYKARTRHPGPIRLFFSSRMAPGKGFDMFLAGFAKVRNKSDFRVILGGSGPEEPQIRAMIKDLQLEPYVELLGWLTKDQLYAQYKQADIFIQADWRFEGTSISLLYALAFGVPSILYGGGGLEWVAKDAAIYFKYKEPEDLARKIEVLGQDLALRERLSSNCLKRIASDDLDYEKQIGRVYEEIRIVQATQQ